MKICTKCKIEKALTEFDNRSDTKDGKRPACKVCHRKKQKEYYENNKEKISAQRKEYEAKNKEQIYARRTAFRKNNKERVSAQAARSYEKNKPKIRLARRIYRQANKDKINAKNAERLKTNPQSKTARILRGRIRVALKSQGTFKSESTIELVGASIPFVKKWIESKFKPGMSWGNHGQGKGKWHIDHIRPCASFDLTDLGQQKECFNYSNLQPLWEEDNLSKGDRYNPD